MAKQLWTEIYLQGQDSLSWCIASTGLNLRHQESLNTQDSSCKKKFLKHLTLVYPLNILVTNLVD